MPDFFVYLHFTSISVIFYFSAKGCLHGRPFVVYTSQIFYQIKNIFTFFHKMF